MRRLVCPICGKRFEAENGRTVYCSDACKKRMKLEQRKKYSAQKDEDKRRKLAALNGAKIDAYAKEARERHISYGKLQTERYLAKGAQR